VLPSALVTASAPEIRTISRLKWLACTHPYRRFADTLAVAGARLGADVVCYSFIAVDSHHFLLTGLPAHDQMFA